MAGALPVRVPASPPVPAPPPSPRVGAFRDVGTVRRTSIHAERYRIEGTAKVTAEVDVGELRTDGILSVGGPLTADRVTSRGTLEAAQAVDIAEDFVSNGTVRIAASFRARSAQTEGVFQVHRGVTVDGTLSTRGALEVGGDLTVGSFTPDGRFEVGGVLRARGVVGHFDGRSRVERIEATTVELAPRQFLRLPVDVRGLRPSSTLVVDRIEAESVVLEGVTVRYLKAPRITLGRHCHITQLEGTVLRKDSSTHVGYESRSPPPHGLTR